MTPKGARDGRSIGGRAAAAASWTRRRWDGLDRGWQASLLGLLAVLVVLVL